MMATGDEPQSGDRDLSARDAASSDDDQASSDQDRGRRTAIRS
jgi:hypothetical protein